MATLPRTEADPIASSEVKVERLRAEAAEGLKLDRSANLSDLADVAEARASLELGTAATLDAGAFDAAGTATAAVQVERTRAEGAEAALLGRAANLSDLTDAATARANLGLGSAAVESKTAFDPAGIAVAEVTVERTRAEAAEKVSADSLKDLNLGSIWGSGELRVPYPADAPIPLKLDMRDGSAASPSSTYRPTASYSKVLEIPESAFSGDGSGGLTALRSTTVALAGSQGQAIGATHAGITYGTYEGAHSLADGIGSINVGIARGSSTRTGQGIFALGRTESVGGWATGAEIVTDNQTGVSHAYEGFLPRSKGIHVHAYGTADSAAGIVFGRPGVASMHTGLAAISGAVTNAYIRDDGSSLWSIRIRGSHEKAAASIAAGAGGMVIGAEESTFFSAANTLLHVVSGATNPTPLAVTHSGVSNLAAQVSNTKGDIRMGVTGSAGGFFSGSAEGDAALIFNSGKNLNIGRSGGVTPPLKIGNGIGFFGTAPQTKQEVTGSRGGNAALTSLLEKLAAYGVITNSTTA